MSAISKIETGSNIPALQMDESELMQVLSSSVYPGAKPESIKAAISWCRAQGKDPLKKPVHIVPMYVGGGYRDVIMPGINDYRTDAARTGQYAGMEPATWGEEIEIRGFPYPVPAWCEVTVYRMVAGQKCAFSSGRVWMVESFATKGKDPIPNAMWYKRPRGQLEKCAEALALRRAFPEVGAANAAEEMEGRFIEEVTEDFTPAAKSKTTPAPVEKPKAVAKPKPAAKPEPEVIEAEAVEVADDAPEADGHSIEVGKIKWLENKVAQKMPGVAFASFVADAGFNPNALDDAAFSALRKMLTEV